MKSSILAGVCAIVGIIIGAAAEKAVTRTAEAGKFWIMIPVGIVIFISGFRKRDGLDPAMPVAAAVLMMISGCALLAMGIVSLL